MSDTSAFSGLKLSDQTPGSPTTPVDQRLFAPMPRPAQQNSEPSSAPVPETQPSTSESVSETRPSTPPPAVGKEGKRERGKPEIPLESARSERPLTEPAAKTESRFDINEKPWRKDSFLFTDSEFDRLEDLKLELRRRFDFKATKNDIARAAFQCLYEDYTRDPARSAVVRHLRHKKT